MHVIRIVLGLVLCLFGLLGTALGLLAIADPVGMKMADDGNPFGPPPSLIESLAMTGFFTALGATGLWLTLSHFAKKRKPE
jgi:hypothetical protein